MKENTYGSRTLNRVGKVKLSIIMALVVILPIGALMIAVLRSERGVNSIASNTTRQATTINNDVDRLITISKNIDQNTQQSRDTVAVDYGLEQPIGLDGFVLLTGYFVFDEVNGFGVNIPVAVAQHLSLQVIHWVDDTINTVNDIYLSGKLLDIEGVETLKTTGFNRDWLSDLGNLAGAIGNLIAAVAAAVNVLWWGAKMVGWALYSAMVASSGAAMTGIGIGAFLIAAAAAVAFVASSAWVANAWRDVQYWANKVLGNG
jgi:hypothetical protein